MSKKKKVLLVTRSFMPIFQGESVNYKILAEGSEADRVDLRILTSYWPGEKIIEKYGHASVYRLLLSKTSAHYGYRNVSKVERYFFLILGYLSYLLWIPAFILFFDIGVIHVTPAIVTIKRGKYQNWFMQVLLRYLPARVILDLRIANNCPTSQWAFDKIIYNSDKILEELMKAGHDPAKARFIPSPIMTSYKPDQNKHLRDRLKQYMPYLAFVGAVSERKCVYDLLEGFARLSRSYSLYKLVIVGPNSEGNRFIKEIDQYPNVLYLGMLKHQDAIEVIRQSEMLVLPSRSEGVPRVCLEAIALRKKVVLPPDIKEFDMHCKEFVLRNNSADEIARKMEEVLAMDRLPEYPPLAEMTIENYIESNTRVYEDLLC